MPSRPLLFRLTPFVALACVACEGTLNLDLQADAAGLDRQLRLQIDRVELVHSDGGVESFDVDLRLNVGENGADPVRLLDGETLRDGSYDSMRLRLVAADSEVEDDSGERAVNLLDSTPEADNLSIRISEDETTDITLHLASFASLPTDTEGAQDLDARLSLVRNANSAALSLTLNAPLALADFCGNASGLPRLYLFSGSNPTVDDLDGDAADALRVLAAESSSGSGFQRQWSLNRVPLGAYRVALSCDEDNPAAEETLSFFCTTDISLSADRTVALNSESEDANCE